MSKEKGGKLKPTGGKKATAQSVQKDLSIIKMRFAKSKQIEAERRYG